MSVLELGVDASQNVCRAWCLQPLEKALGPAMRSWVLPQDRPPSVWDRAGSSGSERQGTLRGVTFTPVGSHCFLVTSPLVFR